VAKKIKRPFVSNSSRNFFRVILLILTSIFTLGALVLPIALRPSSYPISVGAVASNDIIAPNAAVFESAVLTAEAKQKAADMVSAVYLPSDPGIARSQIDNLNILFNYISIVRSDAYSTVEKKQEDLGSIATVTLSADSIAYLLQTSDSRWEQIQQESLSVFEQVMRNNIRDYQINDSRSNIPNLIGLSFTSVESKLIEELISPYIIANSLYSEEETNAAKQKAMDLVQPVTASFVKGQAIVRRGQIISDQQYEALEYYGFVKPENKTTEFIASGLLVLLMVSFIAVYFSRRRLAVLDDLRSLSLIAILFIIFLFAARAIVPNRAVMPYFYPMAAFALILATLFNIETAIVFTLVLCTLSAFDVTGSFELSAFYIFTSLIGALTLGRGKRVANFFFSGVWLSLAGCAVIAAFRYIDNSTDFIGMLTLFGVTFMNGFACASIALLVQYIVAQLLGLSNPLHLIEISRPDNQLLQYVLQYAPGTYQHSLQVSNLVEQGAKAIGADPVLARVGALFHDCGKAKNPLFFIENQLPGKLDSHDDMVPEEAARIIIAHVTDGVALAEKYHLPPKVRDFIREHHGTAATRYQYCRAIEKSKKNKPVDRSNFQYPGPKPHSKETALLMIADGCEARARAELPKTDEELRVIVNKVIDSCLQDGQLDESPLTLRDLRVISETYFNVLMNAHHPRLKYPEPANEPIIENGNGQKP
jgi:putative nucleotidyltransferase with HDIG domain